MFERIKPGTIETAKILAGQIEDKDGSLQRLTDELIADIKRSRVQDLLKRADDPRRKGPPGPGSGSTP